MSDLRRAVEALKPCPFCGGQPERLIGADGAEAFRCIPHTRAMSRETWNLRAILAAHPEEADADIRRELGEWMISHAEICKEKEQSDASSRMGNEGRAGLQWQHRGMDKRAKQKQGGRR